MNGKSWLIILFFLIIMTGCAAPVKEDDPGISAEEEAYYFETDSVSIRMGEDADTLNAYLDQAQNVYELPLCGMVGKQITYDLGHYELDVIKTEEYCKIYSVVFKDDIITTKEGCYIGDSEENVIGTYGEPDERDEYSIEYIKGSSRLVFILEDGYVRSIQYFSTELEL